MRTLASYHNIIRQYLFSMDEGTVYCVGKIKSCLPSAFGLYVTVLEIQEHDTRYLILGSEEMERILEGGMAHMPTGEWYFVDECLERRMDMLVRNKERQ